MTLKTFLAATALGVAMLSGCASSPQPPNPNLIRAFSRAPLPPGTVVSFPKPSTAAQAEIGQSMVSTARKVVIPAIRLEKEVVHSGANNGNTFNVTLPADLYILHGNDQSGSFYKSQQPLELVVVKNGAKAKVTGGVFIPTDRTKPAEFYWLAADTGLPMNQADPEIRYSEERYEQWGKDSFKRELVYSGVSQNTISILYREFQDDMARPAFSQELKYDLTQGKVIGYKGARFEVLKADNLQIQYKVMKALD